MDRRVLFALLIIAGGVVLGITVALTAFVDLDAGPPEPTVVWESDPDGDPVGSPAGVRAADGTVLAVAVADGDRCGVQTLNDGGDPLWTTVDAHAYCDGGGVSSPAAGTLGDTAVVAAVTPDGQLRAYDAADGTELFVTELPRPDGEATEPPGVAGAPTIADATGDGESDIVVADTEGGVHVIDADGEVDWSASVDASVATSPVVVEREAGPAVAVATGGAEPELTLFADGDVVWTESLDASPTSLAGADTRRGAVVAVGDTDGRVTALETDDGHQRWDARLQDGPVRLGGVYEGRVAVGGTNDAWAVALLDGEVVWRQSFGDGSVFAPAADPAGAVTIAVTDHGDVAAVDRQGEVTARGSIGADVVAGPVALDVTGSGTAEVVLVTTDGRIVVVDA